MIKAILFDFGGVLLRTHNRHGRRRWEQRLNLTENELEAIVFNSEMGRKAQHGLVSYEAHWTWLGQRFNLTPPQRKQLETDFWAGDVLDEGLVSLIRQLKNVYKTGLISNAFDDLRDVLTTQFAIADAFDVITISSEEGIMKPDPRIYHITLNKLGCKPQEAVFIDDFVHNIEGAHAVGMAGIHFMPEIDLVYELNKMGING